VVHDFVFGGMENTACTTMTDVLLVPEAAIDHWDPDSLVAHELAHQWFGDLVTCQDWSQGWLNESWATFLETEWWAFDREKSEATWYRYAQARRYFTEEAGRYRRPIVSYRFKEPIDVFDRHLYEKGSCVLSTLKFELGETAFWSGVSHYLTRHEHDTVHTRHFQRALEAKSGRNLDGFFDQWVHSPGHPALTVSLSHKNGLLLVGLTQTQKAEGVPEAYHFQLTLEILTDQGGPQRVVLPVDSRTRTFALPVDGSIRTVRVDPDFRVLAAISIKAKASWLKVSLHDDCPVVSDRSGSALLKMDGAKPFQAVGIALKTHASGRVRASLAARLSKRGGEEVRALLIEALASETDSVVLQAIATGLGVFQTEDVVTALSEKLAEGGLSQPLTGQLLHALGRTRDLSAVDVLKEYLDTPSWANVIQSGALAGLGATRNAAVFETLVDYTLSRHPARVRGAAASALARLGDEVEALRSEVGEVLMALAQGSGFRDVLSAISGLARLRDHRALGFLSQLHVHARDGRVRRSAYEASVLIQRGHKTAEGLETLRGRVDSLAKQNDALRARLDRVELTEH